MSGYRSEPPPGPARLTHDEAETLISTRLDAPLDPAQNRTLLAHLATCPRCRAFAAEMETMSRGLRDLPRLPASPTVSRQVRERLAGGRPWWSRFAIAFLSGRWGAMPAAASILVLLVAATTVYLFALDGSDKQPDIFAPDGGTSTSTLASVDATRASQTETPTATATLPNVQVQITPTPTETPTETATATPEPTNTAEPTETPAPTATPEPDPPTVEPTATAEPTDEPTEEPTEQPTEEPTREPTEQPTEEPTREPTEQPTEEPTEEPTATPESTSTPEPSATPASTETETPEPIATTAPTETAEPTATDEPTETPTAEPTETATATPTVEPTATPRPTRTPRARRTRTPTPTVEPTDEPQVQPSIQPRGGGDPAPDEEPTEEIDEPTPEPEPTDEPIPTPAEEETPDDGQQIVPRGGDEPTPGDGDEPDGEPTPDSGVQTPDGEEPTPDDTTQTVQTGEPSPTPEEPTAETSAALDETEVIGVLPPGLTLLPGPVAFAPDLARFVAAVDGELAVVGIYGDVQARLGSGRHPVWSPQGEVLLFDDGAGRVLIWDGGVVAISEATNPDGAAVVDVALGWWGGRLVFVRGFADRAGIELHTAEWDGSGDQVVWSADDVVLSGAPGAVAGDAALVATTTGWLVVDLNGGGARDGGESPIGTPEWVSAAAGAGLVLYGAGDGAVVAAAGEPGNAIGFAERAGGGLAVAADGQRLVVSDGRSLRIAGLDGARLGVAGSAAGMAVGVAVWTEQDVWFVELGAEPKLRRISPNAFEPAE